MAEGIAGTALDDETARAELRGKLPDDPATARDAIAHLSKLRTSYLSDRAYRLLTAALDSTAVRPIDPAVLEQFTDEARLGRMSLGEAFAYLASLEPRLEDEARRPRPPSESGWSARPSETHLTGPLAQSPHPVLNTDLASGVAAEYRWAIEHGPPPNDDPTPFFERTNHTSTGTLFVSGVKRPRATN